MGYVIQLLFGAIVLVTIAVCSDPTAGVTAPPPAEVERLKLDPFYQKYYAIHGFPIVSSEKVSDYALLEAGYLIDRMLGHRLDLLKAITDQGVRLAIMAPDEFTTTIPEHSDHLPKAYWDKRARGLGATPKTLTVSCGEENLLCYSGDPYAEENILIHEFGHVIHQMGLNKLDPTFQKRLEQTFNRASLEALWKSKYAGTNPSEYWAEGIQSWFDTNREDDHDHNHVNTRDELIQYDPRLAKLIEESIGKPDWKYTRPEKRFHEKHLAGYSPGDAPVFAWPEEIVKAFDAYQRGDHLVAVELGSGDDRSPSPRSAIKVSVRIDNQSSDRIELKWIDFGGDLKGYGLIDPDRDKTFSTFAGHRWLLADPEDKVLGTFAAPAKDGRVVVKD